ncbi:hypothetical protein ACJX0J_017330, partial [Zea mays]
KDIDGLVIRYIRDLFFVFVLFFKFSSSFWLGLVVFLSLVILHAITFVILNTLWQHRNMNWRGYDNIMFWFSKEKKSNIFEINYLKYFYEEYGLTILKITHAHREDQIYLKGMEDELARKWKKLSLYELQVHEIALKKKARRKKDTMEPSSGHKRKGKYLSTHAITCCNMFVTSKLVSCILEAKQPRDALMHQSRDFSVSPGFGVLFASSQSGFVVVKLVSWFDGCVFLTQQQQSFLS